MLLVITDAGKTILSPVISAGSGLVVTKVIPGVPILAVVLPDRAPLSLAQVGPPFSPRDLGGTRFLQSEDFWIPAHISPHLSSGAAAVALWNRQPRVNSCGGSLRRPLLSDRCTTRPQPGRGTTVRSTCEQKGNDQTTGSLTSTSYK